MLTREEWTKVHADLMAKLRLPCRLRFITNETKHGRTIVGQHEWEDVGEYGGTDIRVCYMNINPDMDWRVPEHLILHEAAHHRADLFDEWHGHNEHWAKILCDMYEESGVALPQTTSFIEFAKLAGIVRKNFVREE
jgi:hypothetical protein